MDIYEKYKNSTILEKKLNQLADIAGGKFITKENIIKSKDFKDNPEKYKGEYANIIKFSEIDENNIINYVELDKTQINNSLDFLKYELKKDDIILSSRGTSLKAILLPEIKGKLIFSHNYILIRCKKDIYPEFIKLYLELLMGKDILSMRKSIGRLLLIKIDDIEKLKLPNLTYDQQVEYAKRINNYQNIIKETKLKLEKEIKDINESWLK